MELFLRCKMCKSYLAGPLNLVEHPKKVQPDFNTCFSVASIEFDLQGYEYLWFDPRNQDDLVTHPQWYNGWYDQWYSQWCAEGQYRSEGAYRRRMFVSTNEYGCCGPLGKMSCSCGSEIGSVCADCAGFHWMLFFSDKIERSDCVDGVWNIHSGDEGMTKWTENIGEIQQGVKNGEWEVWSNTVSFRREKYRNKNKTVLFREVEEKSRVLQSIQLWSRGKLVSCAD